MRIEISTGSGVFELPVKATTVLSGGQINDSDLMKINDGTVTSFLFRCSMPTGGNCNSNYQFQWQKSVNGLHWTNISGASEQNLSINEIIKVSTHFRRATIEIGSNTKVFSNSALILVE